MGIDDADAQTMSSLSANTEFNGLLPGGLSRCDAGTLVEFIGQVMPEGRDGEHANRVDALLGQDQAEAVAEAFKMLLFKLSNKVQISVKEDNDIVERFRNAARLNATWLEHLLSSSKTESTVAAIMEALFACAVRARATDIVEKLLQPDIGMGYLVNSMVMAEPPVLRFRSCSNRRVQWTYVENDPRRTPLQLSIQRRDNATVRCLLAAGADANLRISDDTLGPLELAASLSEKDLALDLTRTLLEQGAAPDRDAFTDSAPTRSPSALLCALGRSHVRVAALLLGHGANTTTRFRNHHHPRFSLPMDPAQRIEPCWFLPDVMDARRLVVLSGRARLAELMAPLLVGPGHVHDGLLEDDLFAIAALTKNPQVLKHCLKRWGIDFYDCEHAMGRALAAVCWLCHASDASNDGSWTPIDVKTLLARGAKPIEPPSVAVSFPDSALHAAVWHGQNWLVERLLKEGADVNLLCTTEVMPELHNLDATWSPSCNVSCSSSLTRRYKPLTRMSSIQLAIGRGHWDCAETLLSWGAMGMGGEIAHAALRGRLSLVRDLVITRKWPRHDRNSYGQTGIELATLEGQDPVVSFLLRFDGSDPQGVHVEALRAAVFVRNTKLRDEILRKSRLGYMSRAGPYPAFHQWISSSVTPVEAAALVGDLDLLRKLVGQRQTMFDSKALCAAAWGKASGQPPLNGDGHEATLALLLSHKQRNVFGRVCDEFEATAFGIAIRSGDLHLMELMWQKFDARLDELSDGLEASVYSRDTRTPFWWHNPGRKMRASPLMWAIDAAVPYGLDLLHHFLGKGFRPDARTFLHALKHPDLDSGGRNAIMGFLVEASANLPDRPQILGLVLGHAILEKDAGLVDLVMGLADLECYGASQPDYPTFTPLQLAVERPDMDLVVRLLSAGANINAPASSDRGATALQIAAIKGYTGIVHRLIERAADINAPRAAFGGRTALEGAAERGRLDIVQLLLLKQAKTTGRGRCQYIRAIRLALHEGNRAVAEMLKAHRRWTEWDETLLAGEAVKLALSYVEEMGYASEDEADAS